MSGDGVIVVSHDPSGGRMCGVPRAIRDTSWADIAGWDAGLGFVDAAGERPFAGGACRVPSLEQLVAEFPGVPINVDLKQRAPSMARAAVDLMRRVGAEDRVTLASFHVEVLREVRRLGYRGPTALAQREVLELVALPACTRRLYPVPGQAAQIPTHAGRIRLDTPRMLRKCHALGLRVDYWTINDPADARRLLELGADGIMTDDPAAIAPVFRQWRERA